MSEPEIDRLQACADVRRVAHRGRRVCWRGFGAGAPLVLLHGGHGSWLHWVRNIEPLAARYRVWVPDMPGYGESDDLDADAHAPERLELLIDAMIATLAQLVDAGTAVGVAGFSFGGLVAASMAARGSGIDRLALIGPGGHGLPRRQKLALVDWRLPDPAGRAAALRHNLGALMLHGDEHADALAMAVHTRSCEATRFRSRALSRTSGLHAALDAAALPVLALWGEHDITGDPQAIGRSLTQGHPERRWHVEPGAGHWLQYERPAEVNRQLTSWFNGDGGS